MNTVFQRNELPNAYSMVDAASRIRPRRDGQHHFQKYFFLWTAFNNIYTTIAYHKGRTTQIRKRYDGTIETIANGNVNIPKVNLISEREQIHLTLDEFDDELKHRLITHECTKFFFNRIPAWQGKKIEYDAFGQRINGVINVNHTSNPEYPIWSPIDPQFYGEYLDNPNNEDNRSFLVKQVMDLLHTVRNNLMHGGKKMDDANDITVVENALPLLELIVSSFLK